MGLHMAKVNLSVGEIQGHLRQMHELRKDLTPEERYALMAAVEAMDFLKTLSPGLRKAVQEGKKLLAARQT
jgi:hypothetical protein